jgi:predicted nucleic acid-binding protein
VIVLDASAAVDFLLARQPMAQWVAERVRTTTGVYAPHLIDVEVIRALRRLVVRGETTAQRVQLAVHAYLRLRLWRYPHIAHVERIWQLRENLTAADAAYVALAEDLGLPLVTTDAALARSSGHRARIETLV